MLTHAVHTWFSILIDTAIKSSVVLLAALLGMALLRRAAAAVRHRLLAIAVVASLALPILACVMPRWSVAVAVHANPVPPVAARTPLAAASVTPGFARFWMPYGMAQPFMAPGAAQSRVPLSETSDGSGVSTTSPAPVAPIVRRIVWRPTAPGIVCIVWLAGAALLITRMLAGLYALAALSRRSQPWSGRQSDPSTSYLPKNVTIRRSDLATVPMTWGLLRPVILLPHDVDQWPEERLRLVILHELAHVKRLDWLVQVLTESTCCLYWFNPLIWLVSQRLRMEAEHACDDTVLTQGASPTDYATHLLEVAQSLRGQRAASAAVPMASRASIQGRLTAIIDGTRNRSVPAPRMMGIAVCLALLATLPVGAFHLALKQVSPTAAVSLEDLPHSAIDSRKAAGLSRVALEPLICGFLTQL